MPDTLPSRVFFASDLTQFLRDRRPEIEDLCLAACWFLARFLALGERRAPAPDAWTREDREAALNALNAIGGSSPPWWPMRIPLLSALVTVVDGGQGLRRTVVFDPQLERAGSRALIARLIDALADLPPGLRADLSILIHEPVAGITLTARTWRVEIGTLKPAGDPDVRDAMAHLRAESRRTWHENVQLRRALQRKDREMMQMFMHSSDVITACAFLIRSIRGIAEAEKRAGTGGVLATVVEGLLPTARVVLDRFAGSPGMSAQPPSTADSARVVATGKRAMPPTRPGGPQVRRSRPASASRPGPSDHPPDAGAGSGVPPSPQQPGGTPQEAGLVEDLTAALTSIDQAQSRLEETDRRNADVLQGRGSRSAPSGGPPPEEVSSGRSGQPHERAPEFTRTQWEEILLAEFRGWFPSFLDEFHRYNASAAEALCTFMDTRGRAHMPGASDPAPDCGSSPPPDDDPPRPSPDEPFTTWTEDFFKGLGSCVDPDPSVDSDPLGQHIDLSRLDLEAGSGDLLRGFQDAGEPERVAPQRPRRRK